MSETSRSGAVLARSLPVRVPSHLAAGHKLAVNSVPSLPCRPGVFYQGTATVMAVSGTRRVAETIKTKRVAVNCTTR